VDPVLAARGKVVFQTNCVACHGDKGDGRGVAAVAIQGKKPRDFTQGSFAYGSSDQELFETVTRGVPGTAMPPWNSLPESDRRAVIQYVRTLKN
jgi:cytochrome c oxidase cbb3-type subunit 2